MLAAQSAGTSTGVQLPLAELLSAIFPFLPHPNSRNILSVQQGREDHAQQCAWSVKYRRCMMTKIGCCQNHAVLRQREEMRNICAD